MAKRPSLADSLRASLSKGIHVETAERISRGLEPVTDEVSVSPVHVDDVTVTPPTVVDPVITPVVVSEPVVSDPVVKTPSVEISDRGISDRQIVHRDMSHGQIDDRHIDNRGMVDYSTVQPLTIPPSDRSPSNGSPSNSSPSDIQPSDRQLYDRQIAHGEIGDRDIYDREKHIPFEIKSLPYNQAAVFEFLISAGGITSMRTISGATHVGVPSVKDAVSRLVRRGFMADPVTIRSASFQGFSYVLNSRIVDLFIQAGGLEQNFVSTNKPRKSISDGETSHGQISDYPTVKQSTIPPSNSQRSDRPPSDGRIVHSSSLESFEELTTTTPSPTVEPSTVPPSDIPPSNIRPSDNSLFVLSGPVAFFWGEEEGLQEAQARKWCQDFEVEPVQMRQQLEWARYDIEVNNKRSEILKDSISWFFGVLRKTGGCYPRPANYKSPAEIRAEAMRLEQEREQKARESLKVFEMEEAFQQILADPAGDDYQKLYAQTNEFERELGGETLERVLRDKFFSQSGVHFPC